MALDLARAAFGAMAAALLALTGAGLAGRQSVRCRRDWWLCAKWSQTAEALHLAGIVLLAAAGVLVGLAAMSGT